MNIFKKITSVFCVAAMLLSLPITSFAASNEEIVYNYLRSNMKEMNSAAICGMMASIRCESNFSPTAKYTEKDGSLSYGICQWNRGRLDSLKEFCENKKLDYNTLDGQLRYLDYELRSSEYNAYQLVCSVRDNENGAYMAGYYCAKYFERCSEIINGSNQYEYRANLAKNTYWPKYGTSTPEPNIDFLEIECGISYYLKNVGTGKYLSVDSATDANRTNISVSDVADNGRYRFIAKAESEGYSLKPEFTKDCVVNIYGTIVKDGCNICLWTKSGNSSQHFTFERSGDAYVLRNVMNQECVLNVSGTNALVSKYSKNSNNQKWILIPDMSPAKPVVVASATTEASTVTIEWNTVKYADGYTVILKNEDTGATSKLIDKADVCLLSTSLAAGNYSVTVTASNSLHPFAHNGKGTSVSNACKFTVRPDHDHIFDRDVEVIRPATCTEEGLKRAACSVEGCEMCEDIVTEALGHSYDGYVETVAEATCSSGGVTRIYCSREGCGDYIEFDTPVTEHDYAVFTVAPTYSSEGYTRHLCKVCSYYYDDDIKDAVPVFYGDANADGVINLKDVLLTRKFAASVLDKSEIDMDRADANADGIINLKDVLLIRKFSARVLDYFPPDKDYFE